MSERIRDTKHTPAVGGICGLAVFVIVIILALTSRIGPIAAALFVFLVPSALYGIYVVLKIRRESRKKQLTLRNEP